MGISRDYPLKIRTSKQSIGKIPGFEIIPFHPLKYPRNKQSLSDEETALQGPSNATYEPTYNQVSTEYHNQAHLKVYPKAPQYREPWTSMREKMTKNYHICINDVT
jgi:hypothetical protein